MPPVFLFLLLIIPLTTPFTVGPPPLPTVCRTMAPQHHDYKPQTVESPYTITVDRTEVNPGESVFVTLATTDPNTKFIGFYIQARDENDNALGSFLPNKDTKVHNCLGKRQNAAHHASGLVKKENVTIVWTAPRNFQGEVVMTATCMRDFVTYWVFLESDPVNILAAEKDTTSNATVLTPQRTVTRRPTRTNNNLNETLVSLLQNIGSIFTVPAAHLRNISTRIRNYSNENNSNNNNSNDRCSSNRIFDQWFCTLFSNNGNSGSLF